MLLKLEKCIPISHVTLETVPKYANIERPTSSQLYASSQSYKSISRGLDIPVSTVHNVLKTFHGSVASLTGCEGNAL